MASVFSPEFLRDSIGNFAEASKIAVVQTDGLIWNAMDGFGIVYGFSLPFTVIGFLRCVTGEREERPAWGSVLNAWFLAALVLVFVVKPNINRINALWIPLDLLYRLGRGMGRAEPPAFPYGGGRAVCLGVPALFGAVSHRISGENGGGV